MVKINFTILFLLILNCMKAQEKIPGDLVFIDTHNDVLSRQILNGADLATEQPALHFDLNKSVRGRLGAQVFSIWCDETYGNDSAFSRANREIDSLMALVKRNPGSMMFVSNAKELKQAIRKKRLAAMIGVEGGHMIGDRMDHLDHFINRGMKYLTLTWNNSVSWATSARDEVTKWDSIAQPGLTELGRKIVARLNEKGVMIDISHVGEKTVEDVIAVTKKPVIASHSSVWALNPHRRNLKDAQLKAVAQNGGVVFVNFYSEFLDSTYGRKRDSFLAVHQAELDSLKLINDDEGNAVMQLLSLYPVEREAMRPPLSLLIKHIDYIVRLIGVDHVGIGADYDGAESFPQGMSDVSSYPLLLPALRQIGYSWKDIRKIAGGNFIRVLKANEKLK